MSNITLNGKGKSFRPSFNYTNDSGLTWEGVHAQLAESTRNAVENLNDSVVRLRHVQEEMMRILLRIDRRLAKVEALKLR